MPQFFQNIDYGQNALANSREGMQLMMQLAQLTEQKKLRDVQIQEELMRMKESQRILDEQQMLRDTLKQNASAVQQSPPSVVSAGSDIGIMPDLTKPTASATKDPFEVMVNFYKDKDPDKMMNLVANRAKMLSSAGDEEGAVKLINKYIPELNAKYNPEIGTMSFNYKGEGTLVTYDKQKGTFKDIQKVGKREALTDDERKADWINNNPDDPYGFEYDRRKKEISGEGKELQTIPNEHRNVALRYGYDLRTKEGRDLYLKFASTPQGKSAYDNEKVRSTINIQTAKDNLSEAEIIKGETVEERLNNVPEADRPIVKRLIEYRQNPPSSFALKDPTWKRIMRYAAQVDPAYDDKEYGVRNKMMSAYTSGAPSREINAINTVIGHIGVLDSAIEALNNGDVQGLNKLANYVKVQVGQTPVTTFKAIVARVGPELTKAYVGTGGEASEREVNKEDFSTEKSPAQLKGNTAITAKLLFSKINSLGNQWLNTMKREDFVDRFITPEAKIVLNNLAPGNLPETLGPKSFRVRTKSGRIVEFPSEEAAKGAAKDLGGELL